jgi:hypothetical protein
MHLSRLAFVILVACSHTQQPATTSPQPQPQPQAATEQCADEGTACTEEGQFCGAKAAAAATGFSHVMACKGGTWQAIEVPPPAPQP